MFKRKEAIFESGLLMGGNKINIAEYAPKTVVLQDNRQKKQGRSRRQTNDLFD